MKTPPLFPIITLLSIITTACVIPPTVSIPAPQKTSPPVFPEMRVKNLMDETKDFPREFPANRTLLLIAFQREQQETLDDWSRRLKLDEPGAAEWLELPVIDDPGAFLRWFVDTGMRSGIPNPETRSRVFTIYTPREHFVRTLGLPDATQVHIAVADRDGGITTHVSGTWSARKEKQLREALK
jgi:hypothetical protein